MENTNKKRGRPPKNPVEQPQSLETNTPEVRGEDTVSIPAVAPAKPDTATIRSIRMTDETHNALNELKVSLGDSSLEATLRQMINAFHLTDARKAFSERDTESAQFEALSRKLIDSYIHSLIICNDAEERAKVEVKAMLESKDQVIVDLQQKVQAQEETIKKLRLQLSTAEKDRNAAIGEAEALKMAGRADIEVSKRLEAFQKQLNDALSSMKK